MLDFSKAGDRIWIAESGEDSKFTVKPYILLTRLRDYVIAVPAEECPVWQGSYDSVPWVTKDGYDIEGLMAKLEHATSHWEETDGAGTGIIGVYWNPLCFASKSDAQAYLKGETDGE